ncbi:hypothetical protein, partial [Kingella kingae]|uniref:hypothetical protein n=1 Tax=Kingella kingae TaxID=504 RepID=UPI000571570E
QYTINGKNYQKENAYAFLVSRPNAHSLFTMNLPTIYPVTPATAKAQAKHAANPFNSYSTSSP